MIHIILAPSGTLKGKIAEFEKELEPFDLKIVDFWVSSKTNNINIAVNAHTIERMSRTDTLSRRVFAKDFIESQWLD
jgi:hypothetical protein